MWAWFPCGLQFFVIQGFKVCLAKLPVTLTKHESAKNTVSELLGHIKIGKLVSA